MSRRNIAAFGIYADQISGAEAVDSLVRVGFRHEDIAILRQQNTGSKDFGHERHTKAPAMAAVGAVWGVLIGGIFGWLVSAGTFGAVPWLAPYLAPDHFGAALTGIGAGSVLGLLIGALVGAAIPTYEARRYDGRIRNGEILLSAHCDNPDWLKRAEAVLRETGARGIGARAEARGHYGSSRKPLPRTRTTGILDHELVSRDREFVNRDVPASIPRDIDPDAITSPDEHLQTTRRFSSDL
jgi:hypothetical protein